MICRAPFPTQKALALALARVGRPLSQRTPETRRRQLRVWRFRPVAAASAMHVAEQFAWGQMRKRGSANRQLKSSYTIDIVVSAATASELAVISSAMKAATATMEKAEGLFGMELLALPRTLVLSAAGSGAALSWA